MPDGSITSVAEMVARVEPHTEIGRRRALAELEGDASAHLLRLGAPFSRPDSGEAVAKLRRWANEPPRGYHARVAAGLAIGVAYLRQHLRNAPRTVANAEDDFREALALRVTESAMAQMATLAEWGAVLRFLDISRVDVEVSRLEELFPFAAEHLDQMAARRAGHEAVHGSPEAKQARWGDLQARVAAKMEANPHLTLSEARRRVATDTGWSFSTVRRHTHAP